MDTLEGARVLVTGGSRGLGLGIVEAMVERKAKVTVVARDVNRLEALKTRLGVDVAAGDVANPTFASAMIAAVRPNVLVLNAGSSPMLAPIHEQTWDAFLECWTTDVKAGLHWIQEAIRLPLPRGSRVLVMSSGAAVAGSPLSGGYAGAKRMLWIMAEYANGVSTQLDLGIRFQALVPMQMSGETDRGRAAAEAYGRRMNLTPEAFLARFGKPMPPRAVGEHVATILTDARYETMTPIGLKGDTGIQPLANV